ncbi:MAG: hypothetical protein LBQ50_03000 [Planctomycetaceae bacterium]|jgi:hypothetical protein|nr:hypothetical protein [Planctomycetaceae bacterium]
MTPNDCLLAALRREVPERIPTFEWFIDASVTKKLCDTDDPVEGNCLFCFSGLRTKDTKMMF